MKNVKNIAIHKKLNKVIRLNYIKLNKASEQAYLKAVKKGFTTDKYDNVFNTIDGYLYTTLGVLLSPKVVNKTLSKLNIK